DWERMPSPCIANSNTMVNSSTESDHGPILGRNLCSYQSRPLALSPNVRVKKPASNGMPNNTSTDTTIAPMENSADVVSRPNVEGSACKENQPRAAWATNGNPELMARGTAAACRSPQVMSFQITTIAIHRASQTMLSPVRNSGRSGKKTQV